MNLSVIIPALNEQDRIGACLDSVVPDRRSRDTFGTPRSETEVIVVDGGSRDDTVAHAQAWGATIIEAERGRARQMNAGAAIAQGKVLLFLHADTRLPRGYRGEVLRALSGGVPIGAFPLSISAEGGVYRTIERVANLRSRRFGLPYGDQALFLTRQAFDRLGGYPEIAAMEDYELMRRARKRFGRAQIADLAVKTSARRWKRRGPIRLSLVHAACIGGYLCGASTERIARWRDGP